MGTTTYRRWALVLCLLASGVLLGGCNPLRSTDTLTIMLPDAAGLFVGNDVGVRGVSIGSITAIVPNGASVAATIEIDSDVPIPADAGAVVVARSVATDRYIELTPAYREGPRMTSGATIGIERTRTPVEFDEILETMGTLSDGLAGPDGEAAAVQALLRTGARALDGRGEAMNETLGQLSVAAGSLADNRDQIAGTVVDLEQLMGLLASNSDVVDEFLTSLTDATDILASERRNFGRSLRALSRALTSLATFSREHRTQLRRTTLDLTEVTEGILEHTEQLEEAVEVLPLVFDNLGRAVATDDRLRVKLPLTHLSPVSPLTDAICGLVPVVCENLGTDPDLGAILGGLLGGAQ